MIISKKGRKTLEQLFPKWTILEHSSYKILALELFRNWHTEQSLKRFFQKINWIKNNHLDWLNRPFWFYREVECGICGKQTCLDWVEIKDDKIICCLTKKPRIKGHTFIRRWLQIIRNRNYLDKRDLFTHPSQRGNDKKEYIKRVKQYRINFNPFIEFFEDFILEKLNNPEKKAYAKLLHKNFDKINTNNLISRDSGIPINLRILHSYMPASNKLAPVGKIMGETTVFGAFWENVCLAGLLPDPSEIIKYHHPDKKIDSSFWNAISRKTAEGSILFNQIKERINQTYEKYIPHFKENKEQSPSIITKT